MKRFVSIILTVIMLVGACACGGSDSPSKATEADGKPSKNTESEAPDKKDKEKSWEELIIKNDAVRICDEYYMVGATVAEFVKGVEASDDKYTYDYNPDKLISAGSDEKIKFSHTNSEYFTITATNDGDSTSPLSELTISKCELSYTMSAEDYSSLEELKYSDVKALAESNFSEYEMSESNMTFNKVDLLEVSFKASPYKGIGSDGCARGDFYYNFYVNAENSTLSRVEIKETRYDGSREGIRLGGDIWIVLKKEGSKALVLSSNALFIQAYNKDYIDVTWETCTLREYLNGEFYNTYFTDEERNRIIETTIENNSNPKYGTSGGKATSDKVFLLSIEECISFDFGSKPLGSWWLRSPGEDQHSAAPVLSDGSVGYGGWNVDNGLFIRPALWINLES